MTIEEMLSKAQTRAYDLMSDDKNNIGEKILLMKSGLVTVTAKRISDIGLKLRVQLYNNKRSRTVKITKWDVMKYINYLTNEVAKID